MKSIIDAGIEDLVANSEPQFTKQSRINHGMCESVMAGMKAMAKDTDNSSYKAMTQALFESGFLSTGDRDFNLEKLLNHIYGTKIHCATDAFFQLYETLSARGYTDPFDRTRVFNPSGDDYLSAFKFQVRPSEDEIWVRNFTNDQKETPIKDWPDDVYRKVIYMECQNPAYALVMDYSIFTNEPKAFHLLQIKGAYGDPERLEALYNLEFNIGDEFEYSAGSTDRTCRIITTLCMESMEASPVIEPKKIESVLSRLYSGRDSLKS